MHICSRVDIRSQATVPGHVATGHRKILVGPQFAKFEYFKNKSIFCGRYDVYKQLKTKK